MISKKECKVIKEFVGVRPITKLQVFIAGRGLLTRYGEPMSTDFIGKVLNGRIAHEEVEQGIWDYIEEETVRREKETERREHLFNAAKDFNDNE